MTTETIDAGTAKLRQANLIMALHDKGITGQRAKAAARLIEAEYNADDEPVGLADAIAKASKLYGADVFTTATAGADEDDEMPELHQGSRTPQPHADRQATGLFSPAELGIEQTR